MYVRIYTRQSDVLIFAKIDYIVCKEQLFFINVLFQGLLHPLILKINNDT